MIRIDSMATGRVYWGLMNQVNTGASMTDTSAPSDEYPHIKTTTAQLAINKPAREGPIGSIAPNAVATPFPPLNWK